MKHLFGLLVLALGLSLCLSGCAAKGRKRDPQKPTGFASADAKNVHDFLARYPEVVMSGDVKAIMRLYTDDAKIVPFLGNAVRPVKAGEMPKQLPALIAEERQAGLRIVWHEPMNIQVKGERASVQVVADLVWNDKGKPRQAVMNCYFGLVRDDNLLWRIKEAHGEPVKPGFTLPAEPGGKKPLPPRDATLKGSKGKPPKSHPLKPRPAQQQPTQPAAQPSPAPAGQPAPQDTGASPGPLVPDDEQNPKPLF
jgi:ketosteroid isomerase-like protein